MNLIGAKKRLVFTLGIVIFSCSTDEELMTEEPETSQEIYRIPVVVHVIHAGEPIGSGYNLSKERITAQIQILNNDFRRKEGTPGYNDHPDGADTKIEFQLVQTDPDGNETDGINRVDAREVEIMADHTDLPFDWLPQYDYWNPEDYLNIWLLPGEKDLFLGSAKLPHTDLPGLEEEVKTTGEGLFINTLHFGKSDLDSKFNHGRTLTHEMGHFLGLLHLWGKKEGESCGEYDDFCEDTPPVIAPTNGCAGETPIACNGQPALTKNYMDYTADRCMNMFTEDQTSRMRYVLENAKYRKSLTTSEVIDR